MTCLNSASIGIVRRYFLVNQCFIISTLWFYYLIEDLVHTDKTSYIAKGKQIY